MKGFEMIRKLLNKLGFYTRVQYMGAIEVIGELRRENEKLIKQMEDKNFNIEICDAIINDLKKENEKLKLKVARSVKRRGK